ncbi:GNAT family N-acetyltransferase [Bartonella jaculi]|uniref:N-acetyltransferase domain-containing protein n=1 Tax=Bartonella jaculi TaxID=686226 RepID=A0ABP9MYQ7_9HYPH
MFIEVAITQALLSDVSEISCFLVEIWHDTYDAVLGADVVTAQTDKWHNVEAISDQIKKCGTLFLIAKWMDKIAGHIFFDCSDKDKACLARLYVLPSYQRLGIGEKLLEQAIAINKIQGKIHLKVNSENIKGLSFIENEVLE